MKTNRVIAAAAGIAAVVGLGMWLAAEHRQRLGLSEEHQALERQLESMAALLARNQELSNLLLQVSARQSRTDEPSPELLRLRGEVAVLRRQTNDLEAARAENRRAHAQLESGHGAQGAGAATADYWPRDSWVFAGYATPEATLQSSLWAASNGDLKALLASATGEFLEQVRKDLGGKSQEEAEIRAMDEVIPVKSVRVIQRDQQGEDTAVVTAEFEEKSQTHTVKLLLKKSGNDWKLSGPQPE